MKKSIFALALLFISGFLVSLYTTHYANADVAGPNMIINGSFEDSVNSAPTGWTKDKYGKNTPVYTYNNYHFILFLCGKYFSYSMADGSYFLLYDSYVINIHDIKRNQEKL